MVVSNRNLLFKGSIFRGYVSFRECTQLDIHQIVYRCQYWLASACSCSVFWYICSTNYRLGVAQNPGLQWVNTLFILMKGSPIRFVHYPLRLGTQSIYQLQMLIACFQEISNGRTHWTDPERTWVIDHSSIATYLTGSAGIRSHSIFDGLFVFWWFDG